MFILEASRADEPSAPDFEMFSEPAKSMRRSVPVLREGPSFDVMVSERMTCEREEWALLFVAPILREVYAEDSNCETCD